MTNLVHGLDLWRLDHSNSLYIGLPDSELDLLKMILNSAARKACRLPRFTWEHITLICIDSHFLAMKARIKHKFSLFTFKTLKICQSTSSRELLTSRNLETSMGLRNTNRQVSKEAFLSRLGSVRRRFSYSAPKLYYRTKKLDLLGIKPLFTLK